MVSGIHQTLRSRGSTSFFEETNCRNDSHLRSFNSRSLLLIPLSFICLSLSYLDLVQMHLIVSYPKRSQARLAVVFSLFSFIGYGTACGANFALLDFLIKVSHIARSCRRSVDRLPCGFVRTCLFMRNLRLSAVEVFFSSGASSESETSRRSFGKGAQITRTW